MAVSLSALSKQPERMNGKMTPKGAFSQQRRDANKRKIEFLFTFEEWVEWWEHHLGPNWFKKRGRSQGQFVMGRLGDNGPYKLENVECITSEQNHRDGNLGKPKPGNAKHARLLGLSHRGRKLSEETKAKIGAGVRAHYGR